ncbi:hypothetical protein RCL1_005285 [Eukaryota sp. TZLM3-RCL]
MSLASLSPSKHKLSCLFLLSVLISFFSLISFIVSSLLVNYTLCQTLPDVHVDVSLNVTDSVSNMTIVLHESCSDFSSDELPVLPTIPDENILPTAQTDFFAEFLRPGKLPITANGTMDAVVTFVNGSDPLWFESRKQRALELNIEVEAERAQWDDVGELVFCLRSLYYKLPMIRHVFLVLSGPSQLPFWLNPNNPFITIIYHEEIFADSSLLPVFSSYAIEANLWRIPGLSENFFYLNDDMAFIRSLPESMIIDPLDKSRLVHVEHWWAPTAPKGNQFNRGLFQGFQLLAKHYKRPFGIKAWHAMSHTWYHLNRKVMEETSEVFSEAYSVMISTPFRPRTGFPHFMFLVGHYWVQQSLRTADELEYPKAKYHLCWSDEFIFEHLNSADNVDKIFERAQKDDVFSVCFNDPGYRNLPALVIYRHNMLRYLPESAPWEVMDPFPVYDLFLKSTKPPDISELPSAVHFNRKQPPVDWRKLTDRKNVKE